MITNSSNLPDSIYRAVCNDSYDDGGSDITVTSLIKPPHMRRLQVQHKNEIIEDAADRIFSLLGQATHTILERAAADHCIVERRFFVERLGWNVSGPALPCGKILTLIMLSRSTFGETTTSGIYCLHPRLLTARKVTSYLQPKSCDRERIA
jgi:hypothetical protein